MPNVTAPTRQMGNGDVVTQFVDSVGTSAVTYAYAKTQEKFRVRNIGDRSLSVTVASATQTVVAGDTWSQVADFTTFSINGIGGIAAFDAWADEKGSTFDSPEGKFFGSGTTSSGTSSSSTGNVIAALGDSITIGNGNNAGGYINSYQNGDTSWFSHALLFSIGKLKTVGNTNAGLSGNNTTQMLARLQTDIISKTPKICAILGGTNDMLQGIPLATTLSNMDAMINQLQSAGITPILCTIPPNNGVAAQKTTIVRINLVIQSLAQKYKLNLVDFYSILVDPTTGNYLAGLNGDVTHPNATGAQKMGQAFANQITPLLPNNISLLPGMDNDGLNKISGGLFTANTSGLGTSWTITGTGANTPSIVTDANIVGNWQEVFKSVNDTNVVTLNAPNIATNGSSGWNQGERGLIAFRVQTSGIEAGAANFSIQLVIDGAGGGPLLLKNWSKDITSGIMCTEFTLPAPNFNAQLKMTINAGVGRVRLSQVGIYGLTALGL